MGRRSYHSNRAVGIGRVELLHATSAGSTGTCNTQPDASRDRKAQRAHAGSATPQTPYWPGLGGPSPPAVPFAEVTRRCSSAAGARPSRSADVSFQFFTACRPEQIYPWRKLVSSHLADITSLCLDDFHQRALDARRRVFVPVPGSADPTTEAMIIQLPWSCCARSAPAATRFGAPYCYASETVGRRAPREEQIP